VNNYVNISDDYQTVIFIYRFANFVW